MKIKEFFKPSILKVIVFIILFVIFTFFSGGLLNKSTWGVGFPFAIYGNNAVSEPFPEHTFLRINPIGSFGLIIGIILNLISWYVISAVLVLIYEKVKK